MVATAAHPTALPATAPATPLLGAPRLVPMQTGGTRPPLFCMHDLGGSVGRFQQLATLLGPDQPFYALRGQGREGNLPPHDTVEAMAAAYLPLVRALQPHGPYYLAGYCLGGMIAFEIGSRLRAAGEAVGFLGVVEGYAPPRTMPPIPFWSPYHWPAMLRNLPGWLMDHAVLGPRYTWNRFWHVARQLTQQRLARLGRRGTLNVKEMVRGLDHLPDHKQAVIAAQLHAAHVYCPPPADLALTLFNIRRQSMLRDPDRRRGYHRLAMRGITIKNIAGSHHNVLEPAHVPSLAKALHASLAAAG